MHSSPSVEKSRSRKETAGSVSSAQTWEPESSGLTSAWEGEGVFPGLGSFQLIFTSVSWTPRLGRCHRSLAPTRLT